MTLRLFALITLIAALTATAAASAQDSAPVSLPDLPPPIQNLVDEGAQIRFLGKSHGFDSWLTVKNGQEQYFYVLPDGSAFVMGVLFDRKGQLVTVDQVQKLRSQGDTLLDTLAEDTAEAEAKAAAAATPEFKTPSERLYYELENSNWVTLGTSKAPVLYAFIDPQCPFCHDFVQALRSGNYLKDGKVQVRLIPVGLRDETRAQAAFLLAAPNPEERFYKHLDGDKDALPARADISEQGVQRNLALMQAWEFDVTPMVFYRSQDKTIKIVRGKPQDVAALIADLAPQP